MVGLRVRLEASGPAGFDPVSPARISLATMDSPLEMLDENWDRALAVVAHPDDLEYGAASAIARWTAQGKDVRYVLATRGEAGIDTLAPDEAAQVRVEEQIASARRVGVEVVDFLDFADGMLQPDLTLRRALAASIRAHQPEVIISLSFDQRWGPTGPYNHVDHRVIGISLIDATRDAANRWVFPEAGPRWNGVRWLAFSGASQPTHAVDVSENIADGVASLLCHATYIAALGGDFDADTFLRESASAAGAALGVDYAVTFGVVPA
jgi:LmbE family N-acetylglucosaminyl deacetylase